MFVKLFFGDVVAEAGGADDTRTPGPAAEPTAPEGAGTNGTGLDDCAPEAPSPYPVPDMSDVQLVEVLRALADPIRLDIVRRIADGAAHPKTSDVWAFDVQKSTLSHHFKTLREAGLTRTIVNGRQHDIQLRRSELDERFPGLIDSLLKG